MPALNGETGKGQGWIAHGEPRGRDAGIKTRQPGTGKAAATIAKASSDERRVRRAIVEPFVGEKFRGGRRTDQPKNVSSNSYGESVAGDFRPPPAPFFQIKRSRRRIFIR